MPTAHKIILYLFFILLAPVSARADDNRFSTEELISAYEFAVRTNNVENMAILQGAIEKDATTMGYIMANRPDLYENMKGYQGEPSGSVLVSDAEEKDPGVKPDNLRAVQDNEKKNSRQERLKRMSDYLTGELDEKTVTMVVSGVGEEARRLLINMIKNELSLVKFVREKTYKNSQVEYQIELRNGELQKFAEAFDNRRFDVYSLDLVNVTGDQAEFLLKRN